MVDEIKAHRIDSEGGAIEKKRVKYLATEGGGFGEQ